MSGRTSGPGSCGDDVEQARTHVANNEPTNHRDFHCLSLILTSRFSRGTSMLASVDHAFLIEPGTINAPLRAILAVAFPHHHESSGGQA